MIGLALEGGGAKGSYQAGAYMALKKCGIKIDAVAGTSIGSFNGALIASHEEGKMLKMWKDATMSELLGIDDGRAREILSEGVTLAKLKITFTEFYKILKNKGLDISNYRALVRNSIDEEKVRNSNIVFGLTTLKVENLEPLELFIDDIPEGQLHDYIVASSYLPVFRKEKLIDNGYYLDGGFYNLSPSDMLEKIGCDTIYVINIKGVGFRKPRFKTKAKIIEIKPKTTLGSIVFFDKTSTLENIERGYNDTLKIFGKLDGIDYYFVKRPNWYYERLNKKVDPELYNATKLILRSTNPKDTILKSLEYILKMNKKSDLIKYRQSSIIRSVKKEMGDNIVIKYVKSLSVW